MSSRKHKKSHQQQASSDNGSQRTHDGASQEPRININETERQASMIGGTVLAVCGLLRGSLSGLALAAIGGALIYRGQTGHCHLYEALHHSSVEGEESRLGQTKRTGAEHQLQSSGQHT